MKTAFSLLPLAFAGALALPGYVKERGLLDGIVNDVDGLLGSIAASVDPDNKRPEPGYEFQDPGPDDSRGPCPGLNLLG
jgi:hypothetical protein